MYSYLLTEMDQVRTFITDNSKTMKEYQNEIFRYKLTYDEINRNLPISVRMNMININGQSIKLKYLGICEEIVDELLKSIYN